MSRKTLLTLSVSVTLATISLAPTAVYAQFPVLLQWGRAVRLLGWAPALVLAAI
jgi:hypothetical protein